VRYGRIMCTHTLSLCLSLFLSLSLSLSLHTHTHTGSWVTARSRGDTSWHCHKPPSHYLFPPGPLDSETVSGGTRKEGGVEGRHRPEERAENQATGPLSLARSPFLTCARAPACKRIFSRCLGAGVCAATCFIGPQLRIAGTVVILCAASIDTSVETTLLTRGRCRVKARLV